MEPSSSISQPSNESVSDPSKEATLNWHSIREEGEFTPLILVPPCKGGAFFFGDLKDMLEPNQPMFMVEPIISAEGDHPYDSLEHLVAQMADLVQSRLPVPAVRLLGLSFGGILAWELAKALKRRGTEIDFLILLDTSADDSGPESTDSTRPSSTTHDPFSSNKFTELEGFRDHHLGGQSGKWHKSNLSYPEYEQSRDSLLRDYDYGHLDTDVYLFCPLDGFAIRNAIDASLGWSNRVLGDLRILPARGDHETFLMKPGARYLARSINSIIKR